MYSNETKIYIAIIAGCFLVTVILFAYIRTMIRHHRKLAVVHERQIIAEVNTLERERKRIASDLHDDLGPFLSSIKLKIGLLHPMDAEDALILKEVAEHLKELLSRIRDTSNNLMPSVLINKGLVMAIENAADKINEFGNLIVHTQFIPDNLILPAELEIHLFRIFQETVNNTIKHAKAKTYALRLQMHPRKLHLSIADDGTGFNYQEESKRAVGMGLKNISVRVDLLKGSLQTNIHPGEGVQYKIEIPI